MKRHDEKEMRKLYAEWLESGKSTAAFATEQQIITTTFYYWINKFRSQDLLSFTPSAKSGFKPLTIDDHSLIAHREVLLRINYPSGISIDLYEAVDPGFLRTLAS